MYSIVAHYSSMWIVVRIAEEKTSLCSLVAWSFLSPYLISGLAERRAFAHIHARPAVGLYFIQLLPAGFGGTFLNGTFRSWTLATSPKKLESCLDLSYLFQRWIRFPFLLRRKRCTQALTLFLHLNLTLQRDEVDGWQHHHHRHYHHYLHYPQQQDGAGFCACEVSEGAVVVDGTHSGHWTNYRYEMYYRVFFY